MAKLYMEATSHSNARVIKRADDTRIMIDLYHKNKKVGTVGLYQIHATDGYRVTFSDGQGWTGNEVIREYKTS